MRKISNLIFVIIIFSFLVIENNACISADSYFNIFESTLENLENANMILSQFDRGEEPEIIADKLKDISENLQNLTRRWNKLNKPSKEQWMIFMSLYGKRLIKVSFNILVNEQRLETYRSPKYSRKILFAWIFDNKLINEYAPILFTNENKDVEVEAVIRHSSFSMYAKKGQFHAKFYEAGLVVTYDKKGYINKINGVKPSPSPISKEELKQILGPGGIYGKDPGVKEIYEKLQSE